MKGVSLGNVLFIAVNPSGIFLIKYGNILNLVCELATVLVLAPTAILDKFIVNAGVVPSPCTYTLVPLSVTYPKLIEQLLSNLVTSIKIVFLLNLKALVVTAPINIDFSVVINAVEPST